MSWVFVFGGRGVKVCICHIHIKSGCCLKQGIEKEEKTLCLDNLRLLLNAFLGPYCDSI